MSDTVKVGIPRRVYVVTYAGEWGIGIRDAFPDFEMCADACRGWERADRSGGLHWPVVYDLSPSVNELEAIRLLHDNFAHTLTVEQRAAVRGWLGRVA